MVSDFEADPEPEPVVELEVHKSAPISDSRTSST
jgi:hypothetical protein